MDIKLHKLYKNLIVMMFELVTETQLNWNLETDAAYSVEAWDMYGLHVAHSFDMYLHVHS